MVSAALIPSSSCPFRLSIQGDIVMPVTAQVKEKRTTGKRFLVSEATVFTTDMLE
jgi:hypothetical protein